MSDHIDVKKIDDIIANIASYPPTTLVSSAKVSEVISNLLDLARIKTEFEDSFWSEDIYADPECAEYDVVCYDQYDEDGLPLAPDCVEECVEWAPPVLIETINHREVASYYTDNNRWFYDALLGLAQQYRYGLALSSPIISWLESINNENKNRDESIVGRPQFAYATGEPGGFISILKFTEPAYTPAHISDTTYDSLTAQDRSSKDKIKLRSKFYFLVVEDLLYFLHYIKAMLTGMQQGASPIPYIIDSPRV
jgi:hypothetical protein